MQKADLNLALSALDGPIAAGFDMNLGNGFKSAGMALHMKRGAAAPRGAAPVVLAKGPQQLGRNMNLNMN